MHLLLVLKDKNNVLGYKGKGDFSLKMKKKNIKNFKNSKNNDYMFTGLQIINPNIIEIKRKKFSLREKFFFESILKKKIYGFVDDNDWYHISNKNDLKKANDIF